MFSVIKYLKLLSDNFYVFVSFTENKKASAIERFFN